MTFSTFPKAAPAPHGQSVGSSPDPEFEVQGSAPLWALSGLKLDLVGVRQLPDGWSVGVYRTRAIPWTLSSAS